MKHPNGFSLLELLVVIAILGLLAGAALAQPGRDRALQLTAALRRVRWVWTAAAWPQNAVANPADSA